MAIFNWFWNGLLDIPLDYLRDWTNMSLRGTTSTVLKVVIVGGIIFLIFEIWIRSTKAYRKYVKRSHDLVPEYLPKDGRTGTSASLDTERDPELRIERLKKAGKWEELAEQYAALELYKKAAAYYQKAGRLDKAALEWARLGKPLKAARLLEKAGEHGRAAQFYADKGKHAKAAKAFENLGAHGEAASSYAQARKYPQAIEAFGRYFAANPSGAAAATAAEACLTLLRNQKATNKVAPETRTKLMQGVCKTLEKSGREGDAARLLEESGELARAGELYVRAGQLEAAVRCLQQAGRNREASEIGARYYESKGRMREAAMAYEGAGQYSRAADCYSKVDEKAKAAECYAKAGEFYGAGFALVHLRKWEEAIRMLQKVPEDHPRFEASRALLGRCFYQLHDYPHCVATLENHLTGARVTRDNIDYFWMLALAYEQEGELAKSRDVLLKIRTVDVEFRDVSQRLSNIETRISIAPVGQPGHTPPPPASPDEKHTAVMDMVENSLGRRYRLDRELGRGGMGTVYKAHDTQLDRPVALKFMGSLVDGSEEYRQRFRREAQAAAKVNHPNIVSIYDIGSEEGKAFIAMEFIEGPNLGKYIAQKGRISPREASNIIQQAASALQAIHDVGIVHRDIKPDNILLSRGGLVKVMDFGLAKSESVKMTGTNVVMGTPCYMAPEQATAGKVTPQTDVYALGLVFYEMLTGQTVFRDGDILQRQVHEMPPPPSEVAPDIPTALDDIILCAVAKDPQQRFPSMNAFVHALRQVSGQQR
jgi:tetratricopeptide (TPR) repeat protein